MSESEDDEPARLQNVEPSSEPEAPVYVTRPELPPLEDFLPYLEQIWATKVLSNNGPFHQQLEQELQQRWDVPYVSLFSNGTLALVTALQALPLEGEVITTPFTFAATAHAISWNRLTPVFADIDPVTLNLDPGSAQEMISDKTAAILPVHTYGRPADVEGFAKLGQAHDLPVIYDAAHCFDVDYRGVSVLSWGDLSAVSFHATKVFNTFEGGALISHSPEMKRRIDQLKNFGFVDEATIVAAGINGKMSEFNAALGLVQLERIDHDLASRRSIDAHYRKGLADVKGIVCHSYDLNQTANYGYFPIRVTDEYPLSRDDLYYALAKSGVHARRYFYPLLTDTEPYRAMELSSSGTPMAQSVAEQIICLPIYASISTASISRTIDVLRTCRRIH